MNTITLTDPVGLKKAIEFARDNGCLDRFASDFLHLIRVVTAPMSETSDIIAEIGRDFAPHSQSFCIWVRARERENVLVAGGFIYDGPGAPGDGSFPSLSVNLNRLSGDAPKHSWNVHT